MALQQFAKTRNDVLWYADDLGGHDVCNNSAAAQLDGVAIPVAQYYTGRNHSLDPAQRRHLLTFAGTCKQGYNTKGCPSMLRVLMAIHLLRTARQLAALAPESVSVDYGFVDDELTNNLTGDRLAALRIENSGGLTGFAKRLFDTNLPTVNMTLCLQRQVPGGPAPQCVRLSCTGNLRHYGTNYGEAMKASYNSLMDSVFVLVPRGDRRWSYRFSEVIGACAIPVVISDGLALPFDDLIDWTTAAVVVPEEQVHRLLDYLPSAARQKEMLAAVCEINDKYFATAEKRVRALYLAVEARLNRNARVVAGLDPGFHSRAYMPAHSANSTRDAIQRHPFGRMAFNSGWSKNPIVFYPNGSFAVSDEVKKAGLGHLSAEWLQLTVARLFQRPR